MEKGGAEDAGRGDQATSLLFRSDFCDFDSDIAVNDGRHDESSRGSSELDSDVEDVIYAHMYFEHDSTSSEVKESGKTLSCGEEIGDISQHRDANRVSVTVLLDTPRSPKDKKKRRRHRKKKQHRNEALPPQPSPAARARGNPSDDIIGPATVDIICEEKQDPVSLHTLSRISRDCAICFLNEMLVNETFIDLTQPDSHTTAEQLQATADTVIVISSDDDKGTELQVGDTVPSLETGGDGSESEASDGGSSEADDASDDNQVVEDGEASSDMQISDPQVDDSMVGDPWRISMKDRLGREKYELRYGDTNSRYNNKNQVKCANCKQRNHLVRNCPWPKRHQVCYLCGEADHISSRCPNDLCNYCYQKKHQKRPCSAPWSSPKTQCLRCFMTGHHAAICPDIWRQFHNTTYSNDDLKMIRGSDQRRSDAVFCSNCAMPGHYGFECTRTLPRGWAQPHLPLIVKYDVNIWPTSDIHQLRQDHGVSVSTPKRYPDEDEVDEASQKRGRFSSSEGRSSRKRSISGRGERRGRHDNEDQQSSGENFSVAVGPHPSLRNKHHSNLPHLAKVGRSMSADVGLVTNRSSPSSSLLGTPPTQWTNEIPRSSSLLRTPTTPAALMPPPTRSMSGQSERRAHKRHHDHLLDDYHDHHRRMSEPTVHKRLRLSSLEDFPREPMPATSTPHHRHERLHHYHGNHYDQPHSSRQYDDRRQSSHIHHNGHTHNDVNVRDQRRLSFNNERGVYHESPPMAPPTYHRRMSDYSEQGSGSRGHMTYNSDRHKRHATEDGRTVNSRGFRGQPHLAKNNYRH